MMIWRWVNSYHTTLLSYNCFSEKRLLALLKKRVGEPGHQRLSPPITIWIIWAFQAENVRKIYIYSLFHFAWLSYRLLLDCNSTTTLQCPQNSTRMTFSIHFVGLSWERGASCQACHCIDATFHKRAASRAYRPWWHFWMLRTLALKSTDLCSS